MAEDLDTWLTVGDLDELVREVDRRVDRGDWDGVEEVRRRSRAAIERGHQLWPAASYAEYRLALEAPAEHSAAVVVDGAGWMAPGPLAEVVAQAHTFGELAPHLEWSPLRRTVAGERVVRGEAVDDEEVGGDLPGTLADWEPEYALATYRPGDTEFTAPAPAAPIEVIHCTASGDHDADAVSHATEAEEGATALHGAVRHWATRSEGTVRAVGVEGDHGAALAALGFSQARWRPAPLAEVGALLAWAAADGGAYGRRRGAAVGRFELWWTLAALAGIDDDWPTDPGDAAGELRFGLWLPLEPVSGWSCRLTVEDPLDGLAWALDASDQAGD